MWSATALLNVISLKSRSTDQIRSRVLSMRAERWAEAISAEGMLGGFVAGAFVVRIAGTSSVEVERNCTRSVTEQHHHFPQSWGGLAGRSQAGLVKVRGRRIPIL